MPEGHNIPFREYAVFEYRVGHDDEFPVGNIHKDSHI